MPKDFFGLFAAFTGQPGQRRLGNVVAELALQVCLDRQDFAWRIVGKNIVRKDDEACAKAQAHQAGETVDQSCHCIRTGNRYRG